MVFVLHWNENPSSVREKKKSYLKNLLNKGYQGSIERGREVPGIGSSNFSSLGTWRVHSRTEDMLESSRSFLPTGGATTVIYIPNLTRIFHFYSVHEVDLFIIAQDRWILNKMYDHKFQQLLEYWFTKLIG